MTTDKMPKFEIPQRWIDEGMEFCCLPSWNLVPHPEGEIREHLVHVLHSVIVAKKGRIVSIEFGDGTIWPRPPHRRKPILVDSATMIAWKMCEWLTGRQYENYARANDPADGLYTGRLFAFLTEFARITHFKKLASPARVRRCGPPR
jgi:hypothetical protein